MQTRSRLHARQLSNFLATCVLLFTGSAFANDTGSANSTIYLKLDAEVAKNFPSKNLIRITTGANVLYCLPGACTPTKFTVEEAKEKWPEESLKEVWTTHDIILKKGMKPLKLSCDGIQDPWCSVGKVGLYAELLVIPGDGCLYSTQEGDADHIVRRKYCLEKGELTEQRQPFSYVGLRTKTNVRIEMRSTMNDATRPNHYIKAGQFVEVLLATNRKDEDGFSASDWYLVRDSFGITGWISSKTLDSRYRGKAGNRAGTNIACLMGNNAIEGLCQTGD